MWLVSFYIIKKTYHVIEGSLVSFYIKKKTYHVIEGSLVSFYIIKKTYHVIEGSLVSFYIIKKIHVLEVYILQCHIQITQDKKNNLYKWKTQTWECFKRLLLITPSSVMVNCTLCLKLRIKDTNNLNLFQFT